MKVVILAGGFGTRISEESNIKPKPMIEIGEKPILLHIMEHYSKYGFDEFIICGGYKQYYIKEYFSNYYLHNSDVTFDFSNSGQITYHKSNCNNWKVTVVDTGLETQTAGRIKRIQKYIDGDNFLLTYGDGVSNVNIDEIIKEHKKGTIVTLTTIQPGGRFGTIGINANNQVKSFSEKSKSDGGWINAGFMVVNKDVFKYIKKDSESFEFDILPILAKEGKVRCYKHNGFWKCMDTLKDKNDLEAMWNKGEAPWTKKA